MSSGGDAAVQLQAVVDDVNRHGGILGRRIQLVPHDYDTAQTLNDPATANQAACADWTQDHKVFAILEPAVVEETLLQCAAKSGTPIIYAGGIEHPTNFASTYAKFPLFFNVGQMDGDRYTRVSTRRLVERGFFTPWDIVNGAPGAQTTPVKVGIVAADDKEGDQGVAARTRELARYGIKPVDVIRCPAALTDAIRCQQSATLRLRQNNISHVFGVGYPFMVTAEQQRYRPRYFIALEPRVYAENAPKAQLVGSMSESYVPVMDVEQSEYPGDPSPLTGRCKQVMQKAGQASSDPATLWAQLIHCDAFYFLQAAARSAGTLGSQQLLAGFDKLGSTQRSAITFGSFFGPGSHASATIVRDLEFRASTGRYHYVSTTNYEGR